jgi:hypothetical protein
MEGRMRMSSRAKRRASAVLALGITALILAACAPTKEPPPPPPPPPQTPRDVLVVGDSISFSFGCVLGTVAAGSSGPCPAPGGGGAFTTGAEIIGGCTISGGALLFYNSIATSTYGCDNWPAPFSAFADQYTPELVIIVTSGFELVDRWSSFPGGCDFGNAFGCSTPDRQWGGGGAPFNAAKQAYSQNLTAAINLFRSRGSKVMVSNALYVSPPEPLFPPGRPDTPDYLIRAWYERYSPSNTPPPEAWSPPNQGLTYRPSKTKVEQFDATISEVVTGLNDPNVTVFNLWKHFAPGNPAGYSDLVCPPPNDAVAPVGNQCPGGQVALDARDPDGSHLQAPGGHDILGYYLVPCVRSVLGLAGGDPAKCS